MKIENLPTESVIPYEKNPRLNDDAVAGLAASIKEFGFLVPIVVDKENIIVAGHTRLKAAKLLGLDKVPCIRAEKLSEKQVQKYRLLDNRLAEVATWDEGFLRQELAEIGEVDWSEFNTDWAGLTKEPFEPNTNPETSAVTVTDADVAGAEQDKTSIANPSKLPTYEVICPECKHEFSFTGS